MTDTQAQTIEQMKNWCMDHYDKGADTMIECWSDQNYAALFTDYEGRPQTTAQAWDLLRRLADIYSERQADARNSAF